MLKNTDAVIKAMYCYASHFFILVFVMSSLPPVSNDLKLQWKSHMAENRSLLLAATQNETQPPLFACKL